MDSTDFVFKVVLAGDTRSGKTSFLSRVVSNKYEEASVSTIGVEFSLKLVQLGDNRSVKLQIWDTAGQQRFKSIVTSYFKKSRCAMLFFDITNQNHFDNLSNFMETNQEFTDDCFIYIIGTKCDLEEQRQIESSTAAYFAESKNCRYFEVSARTGQGCDYILQTVAQDFYEIFDKQNVAK